MAIKRVLRRPVRPLVEAQGRAKSSALVKSPRGGPFAATAALRRCSPGNTGRAKRLVINDRIEVVS